MIFQIPIINQKEIDNSNRFHVYCNYLMSLSKYLEDENHVKKQMEGITQSKKFRSLNCKSLHNGVERKILNEEIPKLLRNAWLTEVQIHHHVDDLNYIKTSNHWVCVQSYYTIYLMLRALALARNISVKETHTARLKEINRYIKDQPEIFPFPWKILCIGQGDIQYLGVPECSIIDHSNSALKKGEDFYNSFTRFLKTTRKKLLEDQYKDLRKKKKRLSKQDKEGINLYPTSLFNCLYRLRIRSNYEDADMFLLSYLNDQDILDFHKSIRVITWHTLLLLELFLAQHISTKEYFGVIEEFTKYANRSNEISLSKELVEKRGAYIKKWLDS